MRLNRDSLTILGYITAVVAFIFLVDILSKRNKEIITREYNYLLIHGEFSVGTIRGMAYTRGGSITDILFEFDTKDTTLKRWNNEMFSANMPNNDKVAINKFRNVQKGEKYLVIYDSSDLSMSYIFLNYPIRNSSDFHRYSDSVKRQLH